MSKARAQGGGWLLVDPKTPLPCCLGVIVRESRADDLRKTEQEGRERTFAVRAVLSDHVPLAGGLAEILTRSSYHSLAVNGRKLSIYLHHGGRDAVYFDLVAKPAEDWVDYIEVIVQSRYPSNCFWAARTAVSQLLDSMMRTAWLPLTISRLDLYLEGDESPLCQQLVLPFNEGVQWGPMGGMHQYAFLAPYDALIREAVTTTSPYYRLLCAYRLYEGLQPLRRTVRELGQRLGADVPLPKPPALDLGLLKSFGFRDDFLCGLKNAEDFWKRTSEFRNGAVHFLLDHSAAPVSLSDGRTYHSYSLVAAVLLHYSHLAFASLHRHIAQHLGGRLERGSILPMVERRADFVLRPDPPT
ncbi:MAG: hypothetical protein Q8Q12_19945 [bacterium]|nr:hypothetical protein [bacterium]